MDWVKTKNVLVNFVWEVLGMCYKFLSPMARYRKECFSARDNWVQFYCNGLYIVSSPASGGLSIFLDKSGRGRSKGLCSQGSSQRTFGCIYRLLLLHFLYIIGSLRKHPLRPQRRRARRNGCFRGLYIWKCIRKVFALSGRLELISQKNFQSSHWQSVLS